MGKCLGQYLAHCKYHISVRFIVGIFCSHIHISVIQTCRLCCEELGIQTHCGLLLSVESS